MNLFRVPLNFIVLVVLLADWNVSMTFEVCFILILVAMSTHHFYSQQADAQILREKETSEAA
jgi:hypothetical protein